MSAKSKRGLFKGREQWPALDPKTYPNAQRCLATSNPGASVNKLLKIILAKTIVKQRKWIGKPKQRLCNGIMETPNCSTIP